jgi:hypothetical protein
VAALVASFFGSLFYWAGRLEFVEGLIVSSFQE